MRGLATTWRVWRRRRGGKVWSGRVMDGVTTLHLNEQTGPGEAEDLTVTVRHTGVRRSMHLSLSQTLRRALFLYPRPYDLT